METLTSALASPFIYSLGHVESALTPPSASMHTYEKIPTYALKAVEGFLGTIACIFSLPFSALSYIPYYFTQPITARNMQPFPEAELPVQKFFDIGTASARPQLQPNQVLSNTQWARGLQDHPTGIHITGKEEIEMLEALNNSYHLNHYRMSLEWSEIQPTKDGPYNETALRAIEQKIDTLERKGITTMLTVHHFTDPAWLENGFEDPENIQKFATFFKAMFDRFSPKVKRFATINEPNVIAFMGYLLGMYPPHATDPHRAGIVLKNLLTAHMECMRSIKDVPNRQDYQIGFTYQALEFAEYHNGTSGVETLVCRSLNALHQTVLTFLETGRFEYQAPFVNMSEEIARSGESKGDYLGVQDYGGPVIRWQPSLTTGWVQSAAYEGPKEAINDVDFRFDPEHLYTAIERCSKASNLPIIVTENGIAAKEGNPQHTEYMRRAMNALSKAMEHFNVIGYYRWSLVDNWEWALWEFPNEINFGLFHRTAGNLVLKREAYIDSESHKSFLTRVRDYQESR